jgi:hypothetical protein
VLETPAPQFEQVYEKEITEIMRLVLVYIKSLEPHPGMAHSSAAKTPSLGKSPAGFPLLPQPFNSKGYTKKVMEEFY